ncbi:MAG TPA: glycosyltransferase N-terminal domain-containing protein [Gammaproteobacteria bacterium]|nr:glycosyltransferase N-terminal domain-containing protein [Gammaproteobacteria bacterium]
MAPLPYRLLVRLAALPAAGYTVVRAGRDGGGRYLRQRLGYGLPSGPFPVWLHCASVVEVQAAAPLVRALGERVGAPVLVTTSTPTGAAVLARECPAAVHAYLPLDLPGAVRRFLARTRPACGLVVETELWPNLFAACRARGVPLAIVNGRLSPRTLEAPAWLRRAYARALAAVGLCLARSAEDAERFRRLGMDPHRVRPAGNLKYARLPDAPEGAAPVVGRPYVLAASTREGEELMVARAWAGVDAGATLLVIAPRHPERGRGIETELRGLGLDVAVRSRGEAVTAATDVYLADTLGELGRFWGGAAAVFMGGSLVPKGGHNVLEPAAAGRAVVTGPHTENFAEEVAALAEAGGLWQVDGEAELGEAFERLLGDAGLRARMGEAAQGVVTARRGVLDDYLAALAGWCPEVLDPGRPPQSS